MGAQCLVCTATSCHPTSSWDPLYLLFPTAVRLIFHHLSIFPVISATPSQKMPVSPVLSKVFKHHDYKTHWQNENRQRLGLRCQFYYLTGSKNGSACEDVETKSYE